MQEYVTSIATVLTKLQIAQEQGILQRKGPDAYKHAVGHVFERQTKVNRSSEEKNALRRLFKDQIDTLKSPEAEGIEDSTSIFEGLFDHVFDAGTNRKVECTFDVINRNGEMEKVTYASEPVPIHSRASLISNLLEHDAKGSRVEIGLIDLQDLRSSDFVLENQKHNPGDVLINKAASALRNALREVWNDPNIGLHDNPALTYEVGRYGGDEFMFALIGEYTQSQKEQILETIERHLEGERGYYQWHNGEDFIIEEDGIRLKRNPDGKKAQWIEIPQDATGKMLFQEYFERGLLLDEVEITKIKNKYTTDGHNFDMDAYKKDYPNSRSLYPKEIVTFEDRIAFIQAQHPELALYFDLARLFDHNGGGGTARQEIVLNLIERSIFDPLIGEAIYTRFDFQEHLQHGDFSSVMIIDLKFMKEMNEHMSYADADKAITNIWKKIKSCIPQEERGKLFISRLGGTFVIGVRTGEVLDKNTESKLNTIGDTLFPIYEKDGVEVSVPLGVSFWRTQESKDLRNMLKINDLRFYNKVIKDIAHMELISPGTIQYIAQMDLTNNPKAGYSQIDKDMLYAYFFRGKRRMERVMNALSVKSDALFQTIESATFTLSENKFAVTNEFYHAHAEVIKMLLTLVEN